MLYRFGAKIEASREIVNNDAGKTCINLKRRRNIKNTTGPGFWPKFRKVYFATHAEEIFAIRKWK
jgi:hypothetical protein